ncbi:GntR family transcriptional regulator [Roseibium sp. TrichSKD4]|uniref:GntR family transcriptional regulator n=1 Tax=Roseibium sp. TrichSKD4 TaxID=744980 RepID=UPI0001E563D2|nr:GntR family transcriptional regulator [Roseibium sp. TrichSKD4]EFO34093.1 GntR family transcriptional regulator [Roseibium sp. TrichSKD4]
MPQKIKLKRVNYAYDRLKADILASVMAPGYQAPEPEIADLLGMSRTPVREALIRLQTEGMLDLVPRRGALVKGLSSADVREIHEVLAGLESELCINLAMRGFSLAEIDACNELMAEMSQAEEAADFTRWLEKDLELRTKLFELHGNGRLERTSRLMLDQLYRGRLALLNEVGKVDVSHEELKTVLAAVYAGDGLRAGQLAASYRKQACDVLIERLEEADLLYV